jgi:hypothetical protein
MGATLCAGVVTKLMLLVRQAAIRRETVINDAESDMDN